MSYILDALKKIEHEKIKRERSGGRGSISGDLFLERKQTKGRAGIWKIVALIAVASLVTAAGTWYVIKGGSRKSSAVVRPANPAPTAAVVPPPAVPPPVVSPPQPASIPVAVPAAAQVTGNPAGNQGSGAVDDEDENEAGIRRSKRRQKLQSPSASASMQQPAQSVQAPADIKLSGIAWQDERAARRAVINGFLLKEGAVVSGAKISDIQTDRVRFTSPSGRFEIRLDSLLPVEGKK